MGMTCPCSALRLRYMLPIISPASPDVPTMPPSQTCQTSAVPAAPSPSTPKCSESPIFFDARVVASSRWLGRHARAHTPLLDVCGSCRAPQQLSMVDLQVVYTYVYDTCRVLHDPLSCLPISVFSPDLFLDVSRIILLLLQALGIAPSVLNAVCYLLFLLQL